MPDAPVFVVGWDDDKRRFLIDLSEQKPGEVITPAPVTRQLSLPMAPASSGPSEIQRRLYEARFRNEVLDAYRERCAVCGLRYRPLLDAAHVLGNRDPGPRVDVREGLALCATHHRAFDAGILRYDDRYIVRIALPDDRKPGEGEETMLLAYDGRPLTLPADRSLWPLVEEHDQAGPGAENRE